MKIKFKDIITLENWHDFIVRPVGTVHSQVSNLSRVLFLFVLVSIRANNPEQYLHLPIVVCDVFITKVLFGNTYVFSFLFIYIKIPRDIRIWHGNDIDPCSSWTYVILWIVGCL
ncbi:hypothetical protein CsSME_00024576 [Camellia sinensis var. sinensis]